jgi:hypothetical protein
MKLSAVPVQPASTVEAGGNPALHGQWLFVGYEWAMRFGQGSRPRFAEMIELDLTLRQMELERMRVKWAQRRDLAPPTTVC